MELKVLKNPSRDGEVIIRYGPYYMPFIKVDGKVQLNGFRQYGGPIEHYGSKSGIHPRYYNPAAHRAYAIFADLEKRNRIRRQIKEAQPCLI